MSDSIFSAPKYSARMKRRVKVGLVASTAIVLVVMASLLSAAPVLPVNPGKISVSMTAQVYRDGALVAERVRDDDLMLNQMVMFLQGVLAHPGAANYACALVNLTESNDDVLLWGAENGMVWDTSANEVFSRIEVGEGTNGPYRNDFGLGSPAFAVNLTSSSIDTDDFTLSYVGVSDGEYDWSETGLEMYWMCWESGYAGYYLLCRDVFTPIAIETDDTIVTNYKFSFATGYNANCIKLLRAIFLGCDVLETTTVSLTDVSGTTRNVIVYNGSGLGYHGESQQYGGWLVISDASTSPTRSSYRILGSTVQSTVEDDVDLGSGYVLLSSVFVPSSSLTVRSVAYYRYTGNSLGSSYYFMLFLLTTAAVYVAAGTPVEAVFTLEL